MDKFITRLTCALLFTGVVLWSQVVNGTLTGRVTSANGNAVPNAAVTITNVGTNASQRVLTGSDGTFTVSALPPGTYRMEVESAGYKRASQQNIELSATGPATVNITLEAGSTNETVEIKAQAPAIQQNSGEIGVGLGTRTVRELPVIDRNWQQLAGLETGITPPTPALPYALDPPRNRFFSTNGQEAWNRAYGMDGLWNTEPFRNTAIRVQPVESIEQMNIATANQTVEKGFAGGTNVMTMTRGGTNGWHGSLFEFWSGDVLRTRDALNTTNVDPRYVHNQLGASVGGAIVPDKTFFFGSYEGVFDNGDLFTLSTVPTTAALGGNFSAIPGLTVYNPATGTVAGAGRVPFSGGILPSTSINPTAAAIASYIPAPNMAGLYDNYGAGTPFRNHANRFDGRIDQHFSDRTSLFLRYGFTNDGAYTSSPFGQVIGSGTRDRLLGHNAAIDITHELTDNLLTDFRFGYNRYDQKLSALSDASAITGGGSLIGINIPGMPLIGTQATLPEHAVDNNFNWVWDWSWRHGMHNIKFGTDIRRIRSDGFTDTALGSMFGPAGTAYFGAGSTLASGSPLSTYGSFYNAWASFLLGAPSQVGVVSNLVTPTIRQSEYSLWLGDTVQIMRRLTLDLGVRWEVYSPLQPGNTGGAAYFNAADNTFNFAGIGSQGMSTGRYQLNNVAPRVGLAFRATNRTVFRAGYAINYFQTPYMFSGFMAPVYGSVAGLQGTYATAQFPGTFGPTVTSTIAAPGSLQNGAAAGNLPASVISNNLPTPYVQTFSAQLQQEFNRGLVLSLGYVGALDRHLPYSQELNAALPGAGVAGLPFFSMGRTASTLYYDNGLTSNYNSMQVSLTKRFSEGLSFLGSYTWSKSLGYTGSNGLLLNPTDIQANYGPLDFDRRQVLTLSHLWELPFGRHGNHFMASVLGGWQLNGIFTWSTGTPLTVTADPLMCACPGNTVLANLNGSPYFSNNGLSFLNPASFSAPGAGQFGSLGRGALRGPNDWNYDLSLFKNFRFMDRYKIEIRGEAYNLTNSTHFGSPITNINSPGFGQLLSTVNGSFGRQVNLGLRVTF